MLVLIRGAGDLATGTALRLHRAGLSVVMTDLPHPTALRRTVCFSEAIVHGRCTVEDVTAVAIETPDQAAAVLADGHIPILADPEGTVLAALHPDAVADVILAKRNLGTKITDAPIVVAAGPGFTAGVDCHAVVETMRGHYLGRVIYDGSAQPNTSVPGLIGGFAGERVLRAPADGVFRCVRAIGDQVEAGDVAATVDGANAVQTFFRITLPYMFYVTTPYLISTFTGNVNNFNVIYLLSGGDPVTDLASTAGSTDLLVTWLYKLTIDKQYYNVGAVVGILTFIILAVGSLLTYRRSKSYREEGGF